MNIKKFIFSLALLFFLIPAFSKCAYAGSFSYYLGSLSSSYGNADYTTASVNLIGFNETHGFSMGIAGNTSTTYQSGSGGRYLYYVNFSLPDDGSTWHIQGFASIYRQYSRTEGGDMYSFNYYPIDTSATTSGTFTGVSIGQAVNAANSAKTSADLASSRALSAYNAVNDVNGTTITAVRDASGSVLTAARQANTKIDTLRTSITNIQNNLGADVTPPILKLKTVSGAMATSGSSIATYILVTDNCPGPYSYSVDGGAFNQLPADKIVSLPVNGRGANAVTVVVKDQAGNETMDVLTIRGL